MMQVFAQREIKKGDEVTWNNTGDGDVDNIDNDEPAMHYWLRPIKRGQFRFANFAPHFKGKCHFHFLIH